MPALFCARHMGMQILKTLVGAVGIELVGQLQRCVTFLKIGEPMGLRQLPVIPLLSSTFTSTRRFCARPSLVSLDAVAWYSPMAPGATTCRTGTLHFWVK